MAVGKASVTLESKLDGQFNVTFDKASARLKAYADQANRDLSGIGGKRTGGIGAAPEDAGAFGDLAKLAKNVRKERRASGESALSGALSNPADFALQSIGMGVQGLVVDKIGEAFGRLAVNVEKVVSGEASADKMIGEWAKGLPILGGFVTGWQAVFSIMDGSASRMRDMNRLQEDMNRSNIAFGAFQKSALALHGADTQDELATRTEAIHQKLVEGLKANQAAREKLLPSDDEVKKELGWAHNLGYNVAHNVTGLLHLGQDSVDNKEILHQANQRQAIMNRDPLPMKALRDADANLYKAAQEEQLNAEAEIGRKRKDIALGIEHQIVSEQLTIQRNGALTGEAILAVSHKEVTARIEAERQGLWSKIRDPHVSHKELAGLYGQLNQLPTLEKSEHDKADRDEAKRKSTSLLQIEQDTARERLTIQKANAHDSEQLWAIQNATINQETDHQLTALDEKLKDVNLTEEERTKILQEQNVVRAAGLAQIDRAKEDFDKDIARSRASTSQSFLGVESNLLGKAQSLYGGDTPAARKMQKQIGVMEQFISTKGSLQSILDDPKASAAQKEAAKTALAQNESWAKFASSDKQLNMQPYQPLRFAEASEVSGRASGRAAYAMEADGEAYAKDAGLDAQKQTNDLLKSIYDVLKTAATDGGSSVLWPGG